MTERRARRRLKLFHLLQGAGLLPEGHAHDVVIALDKEILAKYSQLPGDAHEKHVLAQVLPYRLRALALDKKLEPHELGRALYHLGQRRGFKSNRKEGSGEDEKEEGKVKKEIGELAGLIEDAGARTLGEYFAGLDPHDRRIRQRYTSRAMYESEFEKVWTAQAAFTRSPLTDELKERIHRAIFHQRPLKSQKGLLGRCQFENGRPRAPLALPMAQRFRLLQQVNNTEYIEPYPSGEQKPLSDEMRAKLVDALETQGDLTFAKAKKVLGLTRDHAFNWEAGGEKRFIGNRTNKRLASIFGDRWWQMSPRRREDVVTDVLSIQKDEALKKRAAEHWGLDEEAAGNLSKLKLEGDYCNLSRRALKRLLPIMEKGVRYASAVKEVYGEMRTRPDVYDLLPPVSKAFGDIRNPAVNRALTEVRKVANAIVRQFGRPDIVRIELARDLRKTARDRQRITRNMRSNEKGREEAAGKIISETPIQRPSRTDVLKVLLAEESNWQCPYTGRQISMEGLFGPSPQFDVEHIIPLSRCLDDSYMNKTLCHHDENRHVKRNHTPFEAYGHDPAKYEEILQRVGAFRGTAAREKLRRFRLREIDSMDDFTSQQLNDTRYASRLAVDYIGFLYGAAAGNDAEGRKRIQAGRGMVTRFLRDEWGLNAILSDGGEKSRDDHRHHAVDAVVIALSTPSVIKALSDAAARAGVEGRKRFGRLEEPWSGFLSDIRRAVDSIVVSHRVSRKVNGPLHQETNYGLSRHPDGKGEKVFHFRKPLEELTPKMVGQIVDDKVREIVKAKLAKTGKPPKQAFSAVEDHPFLLSKDGLRIPIHRVRIKTPETPVRIADGARERYVKPGSNHHVEIFEITDKKGRKKWDAGIVTRLEAMERLRSRRPIVDRSHPEGRFVFSLAPGEIVELDTEDGGRALYRARTVSQTKSGYIVAEYVGIRDARKKKDIKAAKDWLTSPPNSLLKANCRKVTVTPLGEVRYAND